MKNFELIKKYLEGSLNPSELKDFEELLEQDPELKAELELQILENESIERAAVDDLKESIRNLNSDDFKTEGKDRNLKLGILLIGIIFLASAMFFLLKECNTPSPVEIPEAEETQNKVPVTPSEDSIENETMVLDTLVEDDEEVQIEKIPVKEKSESIDFQVFATALFGLHQQSVLRGASDENFIDATWGRISAIYESEDYRASIVAIDSLDQSFPYFNDAQQLKAKSLFFSKRYEKAKIIYKTLLTDGDLFQKHIYEYELLLTLCADMERSQTEFVDLLSSLSSNTDHTYHKEIQALKRELDTLNFNNQ